MFQVLWPSASVATELLPWVACRWVGLAGSSQTVFTRITGGPDVALGLQLATRAPDGELESGERASLACPRTTPGTCGS